MKINASSCILLPLWQVGLTQFRRRLQDFRWDELIYRRWWESLRRDWDGTQGLDKQALLQTTLYMWQDLGVLSETLAQKLELWLMGAAAQAASYFATR